MTLLHRNTTAISCQNAQVTDGHGPFDICLFFVYVILDKSFAVSHMLTKLRRRNKCNFHRTTVKTSTKADFVIIDTFREL